MFAEEAERLVAHPFHRAIEAVEAFPFPTLAAINGHALGGGLELAVTCDLRIAASGVEARHAAGASSASSTATPGLLKFIDTVGPARTRELFFVGRNIEAERAEQIGLVNDVVAARADRRRRRSSSASEIASNAPLSLKGNKEIIRRLLTFPPARREQEQAMIDLRLSSFSSGGLPRGRAGVRRETQADLWRGR